MFRLGHDLAVRLPRRVAAAPLIRHEQKWLPHLAPRLPLPVPLPRRTGVPTPGYPWHWSVVPWLTGAAADHSPPDAAQARPLGEFLRALHSTAPDNAPRNPVRGVPLVTRVAAIEPRLQRLSQTTRLITPEVWQAWQAALHAPLDAAPTWIHGDLHPRNILIDQGAITGIIDWGDVACGDPATDLAAIWMLFTDPSVRESALAAYGSVSDATICRTLGWVIIYGAVLLDTGLVDSPRNAALGRMILQSL
jgi:aminoglycoside phosphotransferase (APT) family kinase protein